MKKLLVLFSFLFLSVSLFGQDAEELFNKANELYTQNQYTEAAKLYNEIHNNGYESPTLFYNMGNTYFRLGEIGRSILYYEKALKLNPGSEDAEYNLRLAKARTRDQINEVPKLFIIEWWDAIVTFLSVPAWGVVVILFYLALLFSIGVYFLSKSAAGQKAGFISGMISAGGLIIAVIILIASYNHETSTDHGILLEDSISAKVSPGEKSGDAFVIHEGVKFEVQDKLDGWARIKLADGKVGWLPERSIGII